MTRKRRSGLLFAAVCVCLAIGAALLTVRGVEGEKRYRYLASLTPTPSAVPKKVSYLYDSQTPAPTRLMLSVNAMGRPVFEIQTRLQALGYYAGTPDGQFGQETREAVIAFQKQNSLTPDGIVGQETWDKLMSGDAAAAPQK